MQYDAKREDVRFSAIALSKDKIKTEKFKEPKKAFCKGCLKEIFIVGASKAYAKDTNGGYHCMEQVEFL